MTNPKVFLSKKEEDEILQGFPWVFDNEIAFVKADKEGKIAQTSLADCAVPDGTLVEVYTKGGQILGSGIMNRKSKIVIRLLVRTAAPERISMFNTDFFVQRIEQALKIRFYYYSKRDSYRLVFSEADLLPGLVVERYCDTEGRVFLVVQFLTLGMETFRNTIIEALQKVTNPFGIYERSDAKVRELEGLPQVNGWIGAEHNPLITIQENGILLNVDIANGQKTGYFLDQKFNRHVAAELSKGCRVLDTFTHTGAFGLNMFAGGAKEVIAVDISPEAVETVKTNIALNKAGHSMSVVCADVFDILKQYEKDGEKFDVIVLDPPAFTKSAKMIEKAYGGYKEINLRAMKILNRGGILITCSCSHFFDANMFYGMIMNAAQDAKRQVQILEKRGAGPDHPILAGYPKSDYLKCAVLRVL